ncbi:hypothetical protein [Bacillus sp. AFS017336]|uniref:hypothetical protein n=1 Tax=Bacillus sp. AFS017336 TaxID=2033489 RepID=UPI00115546BA|nr:hypothetical protein [Bacillus sp. AFS017336]
MEKKVQLKKSIVIILVLLSCFTNVGCSKTDNIREPISIKNVDLKYVEKMDPEFYIQELKINMNDDEIGKNLEFAQYDYFWIIKLLGKYKNETYEKKKTNSFFVNITFEELNRSFEYEHNKYNGKTVSFYISEKLKNRIKEQFIKQHPVNTVFNNFTFPVNEKIQGHVTIDSSNEPQEFDEITFEINGIRKNEDLSPLKIVKISGKISVPINKKKIIPFSFELSNEALSTLKNYKFYVQIRTSKGKILLDIDGFKIVK